jgi:hypothetical protein
MIMILWYHYNFLLILCLKTHTHFKCLESCMNPVDGCAQLYSTGNFYGKPWKFLKFFVTSYLFSFLITNFPPIFITKRHEIIQLQTSSIFLLLFWFFKLGKNVSPKVLDPDYMTLWIRIELKCWVRLRIDSIRIKNPA